MDTMTSTTCVPCVSCPDPTNTTHIECPKSHDAILWWIVGFCGFFIYALIMYFCCKSRGCVKWDPHPLHAEPILKAVKSLKHYFARKHLLLDLDQVNIYEEFLGKGKFGVVYKGVMQHRRKRNGLYAINVRLAVAIKACDPTPFSALDILKEAKHLGEISHPNIIRLYGVCYSTVRPLVVMELVGGGNLEDYFGMIREHCRDYAQCYIKDMLRLMHEIADACKYIHALRYVHRDLAPRNVLLSKACLSDAAAKLGDFGLAQSLDDVQARPIAEEQLPMARLAPEVFLKQIYERPSDVWQFGVLLWECFSVGLRPHQGKQPERLATDVVSPDTRVRYLPRFFEIPPQIYKLMTECWALSPIERPTMEAVVARLDGLRDDKTLNGELRLAIPINRWPTRTRCSSAISTQLSLSPTQPIERPLHLQLHGAYPREVLETTFEGYEVPRRRLTSLVESQASLELEDERDSGVPSTPSPVSSIV